MYRMTQHRFSGAHPIPLDVLTCSSFCELFSNALYPFCIDINNGTQNFNSFEHFSSHTNDRIRMHFNLIGVFITSTVDGTKSK